MDDQFLQDLDQHLSQVNTSKFWKRTVSGIQLWISPIDYTQQGVVYETIQKADGNHALMETKRVTLANAIVGIGELDLREYRYAGKVFKVQSPGDKAKAQLVDLAGYIYAKMARWDADFLDAAFDVFADLMETHKRQTLKDVQFDNAKDPREELMELEARVHILREQLRLPPLAEAGPADPGAAPDGSAPSDGADFSADDREDLESSDPMSEEEFDPFKKVSPTPAAQELAEDPVPAPAVQPPSPPDSPMKANQDPWPDSSVSIPVPVPGVGMSPIEMAKAGRARRTIAEVPDVLDGTPKKGPSNTPETAHRATPSVRNDVIEKPADRIVAEVPVINPSPAVQSRNPRFSRPAR